MVVRARQNATRYQHNVLSPQRQKTLLREAHVSPAWARLWHVAVPLQILVHLGRIRSPDGVKNMVSRAPRGRAFQDIVIQRLECTLAETVGFLMFFFLDLFELDAKLL